ncbi:hypothetical protein DPMN_089113 [Dreissena polymorpha]|uniref:Uncharacterized protein n=1 Tax=Dreissena polymorpha TaxID=45954 RepID=A0A9D4KXK4_DREPO|nr:hypothetical protein DPMN_089113 [Dreissena polymorpha]
MSETFFIKHLSSGRFFYPKGGWSNPGNDTEIVLHSDVHANMHWKFVLVKDYWGYIEHVARSFIRREVV